MAFYAVSRNEQDTQLILVMRQAVKHGASMAEALKRAPDAPTLTTTERYSFEMLLMRFALLRNKAYALHAGDGILPLVENLGLPPANLFKAPERKQPAPPPPAVDSNLPITTDQAVKACTDATGCP